MNERKRRKLENVEKMCEGSLDKDAEFSIAVSLKRIADSLERIEDIVARPPTVHHRHDGTTVHLDLDDEIPF